jgi:hypothetical protein
MTTNRNPELAIVYGKKVERSSDNSTGFSLSSIFEHFRRGVKAYLLSYP